MRQLELRETLAEAKDAATLDRLREGVDAEKDALEARIGELIDARRDFEAAAAEVRKLMFLHRLGEEIELAYEDTD
jgi:molecular chaperone HscB